MKEAPLLKRIMLACSRGSSRLFRMNVGMGWIGNTVKRFSSHRHINIHVHPGDVLIRNARPFHSGIKGMSDLIGWSSVVVTPEMVGTTVAIYSAVEVKQKSGRPTDDQKIFIDNVRRCGGLAGVARSVEEAQGVLQK
ncbi:MAG: VRR-NUC domain-containing protein [Gammaproteobacteria bacterium]|nr:VRR-NUC domain-containing protein [Gammaproteobacteria bacterium]